MPDFLKGLGWFRIAAMAGVVAALIGFFVYLTSEMVRPPLALLYSGLDPRDSAVIVARLDALNIAYELKGDGTTIMVPQDRALRLRMELAGEGLPAGGTVGYEIFDQQDALGATSFLQNVNLTRALEGELARTIRSLDAVDSARVHLVVPKRELFARENREPSASIVVRPRGRELEPAQVSAIQHLVASAVEGLAPSRVSVVDDKGRLLSGDASASGGAPSAADRTAAFEERLRAQIERIVTGIVGPGKAQVQVFAELDFNRVTKESVTFDPDGQVVRSTLSRANSSNSAGAAAAVSVSNGLPDATAAQPAGEPAPVEAKSATDETVNYEISNQHTTEVIEGGGVKRLSVAVVVDGTYATDAGGARVYQPRSKEEMDQITALIRSAIGYDEKRGDQLEVTNMRFAEAEIEPLEEAEEPFLGLTKADYFRIAQIGVLGLVSVLLIFLVVRPLIRMIFAPARQLASVPALAAPGETPLTPQLAAQSVATQLQAPPGAAGALPAPRPDGAAIDIARIQGQVKESSVKKVGEIVQHHPDEAMSIMRTWIHEVS